MQMNRQEMHPDDQHQLLNQNFDDFGHLKKLKHVIGDNDQDDDFNLDEKEFHHQQMVNIQL